MEKISIVIAFFVLVSCSKNKDGAGPSPKAGIDKDTAISFRIDSVGAVTASTFVVYGNVSGKRVQERGICWSENGTPTVQGKKLVANMVQGNGNFSVAVSGLSLLSPYHIRPYAIKDSYVTYGKDTVVSTGGLKNAVFVNKKIFIVGSTRASVDVQIVSTRGFDIIERGLAYSNTSMLPTVEDNMVKDGLVDVGLSRVSVSNLKSRTWYYVRSFFKDKHGYSYGAVDSFKTIVPGNVSVTYNMPTAPTGVEATFWKEIKKSVDSAVWYFNNYTSATKQYWINYSPGTPTADCNNEGWIRVGSSSNYWTIGTMMHEMNHGMGTGTTTWWSSIMKGGVYTGENATKIVRLCKNNPDLVLSGDAQHWWPGGINQNSEVTSSWDYVYNALIIEGMRQDGLTHSGAYTAP